jgi:hypothetical protein
MVGERKRPGLRYRVFFEIIHRRRRGGEPTMSPAPAAVLVIRHESGLSSQKKPAKVYYLFYAGTMQERAMQLMGKKMKASLAIEADDVDSILKEKGKGMVQFSMFE